MFFAVFAFLTPPVALVALIAAKLADASYIRSAIEATKGYVGISGVYNMSPEDHCGLDVDSLVMIKVEDGKWKLLE